MFTITVAGVQNFGPEELWTQKNVTIEKQQKESLEHEPQFYNIELKFW